MWLQLATSRSEEHRPEMEGRQTIEPPPAVTMCSIMYLHVKNIPRPSTAITWSYVVPGRFSDLVERDDSGIGNEDVDPAVPLDAGVDHPVSIPIASLLITAPSRAMAFQAVTPTARHRSGQR